VRKEILGQWENLWSGTSPPDGRRRTEIDMDSVSTSVTRVLLRQPSHPAAALPKSCEKG
jgi:hypothetical protein